MPGTYGIMDKRKQFLIIFKAAKKKYGKLEKRLSAEGWKYDWQTLISTIMSAQSRDETTIPIAEKLFRKYNTLDKLANAKYVDVLKTFKSLNYNKTKAKHVIEAAKFILKEFRGKLPEEIEDLIKIPGVGRKTANIVRVEVHGRHAIPVDTHVHRLANVLELVKTKTPEQTEFALMDIVPKKYWIEVNRIFVLWGKDVPGRDKNKLLRRVGLRHR
jgi:endonuclease-3